MDPVHGFTGDSNSADGIGKISEIRYGWNSETTSVTCRACPPAHCRHGAGGWSGVVCIGD